MMASVLLPLAASFLVIAIVGAATTSLSVVSVGRALLAAVVITVFAAVASSPLVLLESWLFGGVVEPGASSIPAGPELYLHLALRLVVKTIVVFLACLITPGVYVRGWTGPILAAALLTGTDFMIAGGVTRMFN